MRTMTATEAARGFSDVLDEAERGETIEVTRGGRAVARIVPVQATSGARLAAVVKEWQGTLDDDFGRDIADGLAFVDPGLDADPWADE